MNLAASHERERNLDSLTSSSYRSCTFKIPLANSKMERTLSLSKGKRLWLRQAQPPSRYMSMAEALKLLWDVGGTLDCYHRAWLELRCISGQTQILCTSCTESVFQLHTDRAILIATTSSSVPSHTYRRVDLLVSYLAIRCGVVSYRGENHE